MTVEDSDKERWYAMRSYKNEKEAESMLSGKDGLPHFIPKKYAMRTYHGKKTLKLVPVIPSLIFVHASYRQIIAFKQSAYDHLQFIVMNWEGANRYITIRDKEMKSFIRVCEQHSDDTRFYHPEDIRVEKGTRVRVHGGALDNVEGIFVKVTGKRSKQLVVLLTGVMAVSTTVQPEYLEVLEE
ncbi:MAG: UpxY family transcription antiterminator [Prevotellaceae bacterium]|nr:UpxY family transcription antiterminator [Prevotellaceae bacterium]